MHIVISELIYLGHIMPFILILNMSHYINNWSCIMKPILFFHRNIKCGFSINKVSQTFIRKIDDYQEFYAPFKSAEEFIICFPAS